MQFDPSIPWALQWPVIKEFPAMEPPAGIQPNFDNPPNKLALCIGVMAASITIPLVATLIRAYVQWILVRRVYLEDWFHYMAWLSWMGYCVPAFLNLKRGAIVHQWDFRLGDMTDFVFMGYISTVLWSPVMLLSKAAIVCQFLRLFEPPGQKSYVFWICHALIWANVIFYASFFGIYIFACQPRSRYWDMELIIQAKGSCLKLELLDLINGALNIASDATILAFPQAIIWSLHLPRRQKIIISSLFFLGVFNCVFSALRQYFLVKRISDPDQTYTGAALGILTFPAIASGLLIPCLPIFPKFIEHLGGTRFGRAIHSVFRTRSRTTTRSDSQGIGLENTSSQDSDKRIKDAKKIYVNLRDSQEMLPTSRSDSNANTKRSLDEQDLLRQQALAAPPTGVILRTVHFTSTYEQRAPEDETAMYRTRVPWATGMPPPGLVPGMDR